MASKMTDEKIAALVAKELERRELKAQEQLLADEKIEQISMEISAVKLTYDQLVVAIRAVIPDEEPHTIVLQAMLDWIYVAQAAKIGSLRHQRQALLAYTQEEIAEFASDSEMMEFPCDFQTLIAGIDTEELDDVDLPENKNLLQSPLIIPVASVIFGMVVAFFAMFIMGRIF